MRTELIGKTIGNYTVVRRLGVGGMGEVYEAQQPAIGARVAIKVLNADATDPAGAQRFLIEAQAVNRIQHDGVVKIIDAGYTDDDRPYLVMEYLDGASLAEVMAGGTANGERLPMGSACRVIADVLAVLAAAHAEGIVHRDLKPHNIFLTRSGRTVVLDFGVAKLLDSGGSVSLTLTGAILGTPAYMAPEQIQDEKIDGRADLYALGVVLYELVTGRRPFESEQTYDLLTAHVERRPPPPRAIRPEVPVEVQAVLMSALAKERDDRFASAEAMRSALLQAASVLPAQAFAAMPMPGAPPRRTPTTPPSASGPLAVAAKELAAATVPMPIGKGSGPARGIGPESDPTVRGKAGAGRVVTAPPEDGSAGSTLPGGLEAPGAGTISALRGRGGGGGGGGRGGGGSGGGGGGGSGGSSDTAALTRGDGPGGGSAAATRPGGAAAAPATRAGGAAPSGAATRAGGAAASAAATRAGGAGTRADGVDALRATVPDHSARMSGDGLPPPPGASTAVPTSRRPLVIALVALGAAAVFFAFVIGRFIGSHDSKSSAGPVAAGSADAALVVTPVEVDAAPTLPRTVPKSVEDRLFRNHLAVADLPPPMLELLAAADRAGQVGSAVGNALEAQLPALLDAIDAMTLAADRIEAKLHRVQQLLADSKLPGRTTDGVGDLITAANQKLTHGDTVGANDQLWRAEWILEHDGKAPPR